MRHDYLHDGAGLCNQAHCLEIIQTVRGPLYRVTKFLSTRQQVLDACEFIMSESDDGKKLLTGPDGTPLTGVLRAVAIADFTSIYGDYVAKHLNKCRTNSQSQVKAALKALVGGPGPHCSGVSPGYLPSRHGL